MEYIAKMVKYEKKKNSTLYQKGHAETSSFMQPQAAKTPISRT